MKLGKNILSNFLDSFWTQYYDDKNFILKDFAPYQVSPKTLSFEDINWNTATINFQFISPFFTFPNEKIVTWNEVVLLEDWNLEFSLDRDIDVDSTKIFLAEVWFESWFDHIIQNLQISDPKNISLDSNGDVYNIVNGNNYDFNIVQIKTFSKDSCDSEKYWYNVNFPYSYVSNYSIKINNVFEKEVWNTFYWAKLDLKKHNWTSFESHSSYDLKYPGISFNEYDYDLWTEINTLEDWLYSFSVSDIDTAYNRICTNQYNSPNTNTKYVNSQYFIISDWKTLEYTIMGDKIEFDRWSYIYNLQDSFSQKQIELSQHYNVSATDSNWEVIASIDKDCYINWSCNFSNRVNNYINNLPDGEKVKLEISYKDSFIDYNKIDYIWANQSSDIDVVFEWTYDNILNTSKSHIFNVINAQSLKLDFYDKDNKKMDFLEITDIDEYYNMDESASDYYFYDAWVGFDLIINNDTFPKIEKIDIYLNDFYFWYLEFDSIGEIALNKNSLTSEGMQYTSYRKLINATSSKLDYVNFEGLLFNRKLSLDAKNFTNSNFGGTYWNVLNKTLLDINFINTQNITSVDKSKLYICKNPITSQELFNNIDNLVWCYTLKEIEENKIWFYVNNISSNLEFFDIFIYGKNWVINDDFKSFDLNFKIYFSFFNEKIPR